MREEERESEVVCGVVGEDLASIFVISEKQNAEGKRKSREEKIEEQGYGDLQLSPPRRRASGENFSLQLCKCVCVCMHLYECS